MPFAVLPDGVKRFARFLPTTYLVDTYSSVIVRGEGLLADRRIARRAARHRRRRHRADVDAVPVGRHRSDSAPVAGDDRARLCGHARRGGARRAGVPDERPARHAADRARRREGPGAACCAARPCSTASAAASSTRASSSATIASPRCRSTTSACRCRRARRSRTCSGRYLIPGLFDSHVHWGGSGGIGAAPIEQTDDRLAHDFGATLAAGVTSVVSLTDDLEDMRSLSAAVAAARARAPRTFFAGPSITAKGGHPVGDVLVPARAGRAADAAGRNARSRRARRSPSSIASASIS